MTASLNPQPEKGVTSRREFMRGGMRHLFLGGLALAGAWLVTRTGRRTCDSQGACSTCPDYTACLLPEAASRKQALNASPAPVRDVSTNNSGGKL